MSNGWGELLQPPLEPASRAWQPSLDGAARPEAPTLLQLAAQLHTARANPQIWRETLLAFRDYTPCRVVHDLGWDTATLTPDGLAALAGRLTHCATYGGECTHECGGDTQPSRSHCAQFAVHMHTAALAAHKALQASVFDYLPATWIVDRSGLVLEANAAAQALIRSGERFAMMGAGLKPLAPSGASLLRRALTTATADERVFWSELDGSETTLLLRPLPNDRGVAVSLQPARRSWAEVAALLAQQLGLTPRRSELGAHLLEGHTLSHAARVMGISRHTANEHLAALLLQVGVADRKALLLVLRGVTHR